MDVMSKLGKIYNYEGSLFVIALLFYGEIFVEDVKKFRSLTLNAMHERSGDIYSIF